MSESFNDDDDFDSTDMDAQVDFEDSNFEDSEFDSMNMNDTFVEMKSTDLFGRIKNSVLGAFFGIILFFASFGVLYWNEGRVNFADVAQGAIATLANTNSTAKIGDLISVTGTLTSGDRLGDDPYLAIGEYVALKRNAEMYAWEEEKKTEKLNHLGGKQTETTAYSYHKTWQENPEDSSSFRDSQGHENPKKLVDSKILQVPKSQIGNYSFPMDGLKFPLPSKINLTSENVLPQYRGIKVENYLFMGNGKFEKPLIGDIRISYQALEKNMQATIFGSLAANNQLAMYQVKKNVSFYQLLQGTREQAIQSLKREHAIWTWIFRGTGFLMMWIGLGIVLDPLIVILDFIPLLGDIASATSRFATFVISAILTGLTICVSIILHSPILVYSGMGLGAYIIYRWITGRKTN